MTDRVRDELIRTIQDRKTGFVFCSARTGVNLTVIRKGFISACLTSEIPYGQNTTGGLTLHDLRHTFSTRLAARGANEQVRMALLGQSSLKMVRRYTHATPEAMQENVKRLAERPGVVLKFKKRKKA
jgi:integrase